MLFGYRDSKLKFTLSIQSGLIKWATFFLVKFPLPHWRGSSHGQTRIIRFSYAEAYYSKMVGEARKMWEEIETKAQQEIMIT